MGDHVLDLLIVGAGPAGLATGSEPHPYYRKRVVVVSGRDAPPVFIENGRAHGEKIVRTLKGRL